jgi:hypothetical protein
MLTRLMRNQIMNQGKSSMRVKNFYGTNDSRKYESVKEPQEVIHYYQ